MIKENSLNSTFPKQKIWHLEDFQNIFEIDFGMRETNNDVKVV